MPEVTVRDARPQDATAIAGVWAEAVPYLVRSLERAADDLARDASLGRRRWVAVEDGVVVGLSAARVEDADELRVGVEVLPAHGSRGIGTALLQTALAAFPTATTATSVCNGDPIALAFAVRHNFVPRGEHHVARVVPRRVGKPGPVPDGLTEVTLADVDLDALLVTNNSAAADDPSGLSRSYTRAEFLADWWDGPDNAPALSWALRDDTGVVAAFTSLSVDRTRARAWTSMTATHPSYRGRGLATWVKRRAMAGLAEARITEAWTANDASNEPMLAVNRSLGYEPAARSVRVVRRLRG